MQGVMGILGTEPGQDGFAMVRLAVAIGILEKGHMRFLRDIDSAITKLKGERHVKILSPNR